MEQKSDLDHVSLTVIHCLVGSAGRSLSDYVDLAAERTPMLGGMEEISYAIPTTEVRCDPK